MCANRDVFLGAADCWIPPGRSSFARAVLAPSLAAFLCFPAAVANAASTDALLSNLDEDNGIGIVVAAPADASAVGAAQAIGFQTGTSERGYNLTSVKVVLANAADSDGVRVRIFSSRSNGTPYLSLYTLSNPAISDGILTFTAPASAYLKNGSL